MASWGSLAIAIAFALVLWLETCECSAYLDYQWPCSVARMRLKRSAAFKANRTASSAKEFVYTVFGLKNSPKMPCR